MRRLMTVLVLVAAFDQAHGALQYVRSSHGVLDYTLNIVRGQALIGGLLVNNTITFNGCVRLWTLQRAWAKIGVLRGDPTRPQPPTPTLPTKTRRLYPGPTLVAQRGDCIRLLAVNQIDLAANLHFHGFHVSPEVGARAHPRIHGSVASPLGPLVHGHVPFPFLPQGTADNMMITIEPGQQFQYDFVVADNQPIGLQWVHGHVYGTSDEQMTLGQSSMFLIEGKGGAMDVKGEDAGTFGAKFVHGRPCRVASLRPIVPIHTRSNALSYSYTPSPPLCVAAAPRPERNPDHQPDGPVPSFQPAFKSHVSDQRRGHAGFHHAPRR